MSMSSIRDWFANVDISHVDWRMRWPLIILPFLLFALVILLFRASQLSAEQDDASAQLQELVQPDSSFIPDSTTSLQLHIAGVSSNQSYRSENSPPHYFATAHDLEQTPDGIPGC